MVLIIILISIIIFLCIKIPTILNEKKVYKYINDNNYKLDSNNVYTLTTTNNNITTSNKLFYDKYFFSKCVIETNNTKITKYNYFYTKNKEIIIEYEISDFINNEFKMESVKATYKNNKLLNCENIIGNLNCDNLNAHASNYEKEIKLILETNKINVNFLKNLKLNTNKKN